MKTLDWIEDIKICLTHCHGLADFIHEISQDNSQLDLVTWNLHLWEQQEPWKIKKMIDELNISMETDGLRHIIALAKWRKYKQVYRIDRELESSLMNTDTIVIPNGLLDKIPYKSLYLECDREGIMGQQFEGILINIIPINKQSGYLIEMYSYTINNQFSRCWIVTGGSDYINTFKNIINNTDYSNDEMRNVFVYAVNSILYLCSSNCDMQESEITKRTYKQPQLHNIKDKFKEVQIFECGYRYGNTIRLNKKKYLSISTPGNNTGISHRPHSVRGHFHTYKVGKGRTETEIKWLEPYFTGVGESIPTIHKVVEG